MNAFLGFDNFMHPWALALLVGVVLLLIAELAAKAGGTMTISTGDTLARIQSSRKALLRRLPAILRALGLALLVIALARPLKGLQARPDRTDVVDIMLCVDVSGSMQAMDFSYGGRSLNRLEVTKEAVRDFIESRKMKSTDRYGIDRVGLVLYAGYAWTQCPLTLDYGILERELDLARIADSRGKQGTAIGSAIGLAVSKLRKSEAKSKVIILLTDGLNNAGELDPLTAAQIAKDYGIRIYTIGAGSQDEVLVPQQGILGVMMAPMHMPIDVETLEKIANMTGAKFYRATDTESLQGAYAEINQLETTEIEISDYYEYEEVFMPWAIAGTLVLSLAVFGRRLWFEPIP